MQFGPRLAPYHQQAGTGAVELESPFILLADKKISNEMLPVLEAVAKAGQTVADHR